MLAFHRGHHEQDHAHPDRRQPADRPPQPHRQPAEDDTQQSPPPPSTRPRTPSPAGGCPGAAPSRGTASRRRRPLQPPLQPRRRPGKAISASSTQGSSAAQEGLPQVRQPDARQTADNEEESPRAGREFRMRIGLGADIHRASLHNHRVTIECRAPGRSPPVQVHEHERLPLSPDSATEWPPLPKTPENVKSKAATSGCLCGRLSRSGPAIR